MIQSGYRIRFTGTEVDALLGQVADGNAVNWNGLSEEAKSSLVAVVLSHLAQVATTGAYADLVGTPKLGRDPS